MKDYFIGNWTDSDIKLLANENAFIQNIDLPELKTIQEYQEWILENGNIGDTSATKLYENDNWLVFLSNDSATQVINHIHKFNHNLSEFVEIN